ncbi:leucine-rich repeat-containing protein 40-like [Patiria miniata]|uniref:Disease resistance R13L4/SHOC-2-like LRR domain-containing protein n=1 Tax=Patiria miniata TaxID=46514 RepID=A0A913ZBT6_PATMI|nr:leucine-rich repeat-containing protein 40-like [Patiria miniata]
MSRNRGGGVGGRAPLKPRAGFQKPAQQDSNAVSSALLKQAMRSGQLNLSNRELAKVPDSVWRINIDIPEEAKTVSLDKTEDGWWEQTDLVKLILACNKLQEISNDIQQLPALTVLDVHDNVLTSLPPAIGELLNLQKLNISHNKITSLPSEMFQLRHLLSFHVEHNDLTELPEGIGEFIHLEELNLSHNKLTTLPYTAGHLGKLKTLNVSDNQLTSLPTSMGMLKAVRILEASNNKLPEIPTEVGDMKSLEQLYLQHNVLSGLPLLRACISLKELFAGNNRITVLSPDHLEHLATVNVLSMRDNKLYQIPEEIVNLRSLHRLDLTNNNISSLPNKLGTLTSLKSLVLDGNPMRGIRRDIISRGTQGILKFLRSRIEEEPSSKDATDSVSASDPSSAMGVVAAVTSKTLDYSNKKVAEVPVTLWEPAREAGVANVNLSKNVFTEVPTNVILLAKTVTELNLSFNKLTTLPAELQMMVNLTHLDLRNNAISTLPSEWSTLVKLREISLSCNRLKEVPAVVYQWAELENLLLADNQIGLIDVVNLLRLPKLSTLDLQNNDVMQVPPELGNVQSLRSLQLGGNPFRNPRPAVLAKGTPALLAFLRDRIPT